MDPRSEATREFSKAVDAMNSTPMDGGYIHMMRLSEEARRQLTTLKSPRNPCRPSSSFVAAATFGTIIKSRERYCCIVCAIRLRQNPADGFAVDSLYPGYLFS
jgi:hypothetical protein